MVSPVRHLMSLEASMPPEGFATLLHLCLCITNSLLMGKMTPVIEALATHIIFTWFPPILRLEGRTVLQMYGFSVWILSMNFLMFCKYWMPSKRHHMPMWVRFPFGINYVMVSHVWTQNQSFAPPTTFVRFPLVWLFWGSKGFLRIFTMDRNYISVMSVSGLLDNNPKSEFSKEVILERKLTSDMSV